MYINHLLSQRLGAAGDVNFCFSKYRELQELLGARQRLRVSVVAAIALMLAMAGMGIAVVLLVAAAERSQELGMKRAGGATVWRLRGEVVAEGLTIAFLGSLGGIALGIGLTVVLWMSMLGVQESGFLARQQVMRQAVELPAGFTPSVSWQAMMLACLISLLTSLVASLTAASAIGQFSPATLICSRSRIRSRLAAPLTLLQGALGVCVTLVLVSMFQGLGREEVRQIRQFLDTDKVMVTLPKFRVKGRLVWETRDQAMIEQVRTLCSSEAELTALAARMPEVAYLGSRVELVPGRVLDVAYHGKLVGGASAVSSDYFAVNSGRLKLSGGRFPTAEEFAAGRPVCVIDRATYLQLFGAHSAVGEQIRIDGLPFTVVGVLDRDSHATSGSAFLPLKAASRQWLEGNTALAYYLYLQLRDERRYEAATTQIGTAFGHRLRLPSGTEVTMAVPAQEAADAMAQIERLSVRAAVPGLLAMAIAVIGLVNLLLIGVQEDIREVGLRRALGATVGMVLRGYLWRGTRLALGSALLGLLLGVLVVRLLGAATAMTSDVPPHWVLFCGGLLVLVESGAALLPAIVAARIHPVEALRYE